MSVYSDIDLDTPAAKSKHLAATLAGDALTRLDAARERGLDLAGVTGRKAAAYARGAAGHARRRPVSTGLIAAAVGMGLVFLLSRTARSATVAMGESLWDRYGRR